MGEKEFQETFFGPLQEQIAEIQGIEAGARRRLLDLICPDVLHRKLTRGAQQAQRANSRFLSPSTCRSINAFLERARTECSRVKPQWEALDHYDRHGTWDGAKAGLLSDETQIGATVGNLLLGDIGAFIGGAMGGWFAASRLEEQAGKVLTEYGLWLDHWIESVKSECQTEIWPIVAQDLQRVPVGPPVIASIPASTPRGSGGRWVALALAIAFVIALVGVGGWMHYTRDGAPPTPQALATTASVDLQGLVGRWQADGGPRYDAVLEEEALSLRRLPPVDVAREGYLAGEEHIRLLPGDGSGFRVEVWLRPPAPAGLHYPRAGLPDCRVRIGELAGEALRARLDGQFLRIELAQLPPDKGLVEARQGRISRCQPGLIAAAKRTTLVLARVQPEETATSTKAPRRKASRGTRSRSPAEEQESAQSP